MSFADIVAKAKQAECDILTNSWPAWELVAKCGTMTEPICVFGWRKPSQDVIKFFFNEWLASEPLKQSYGTWTPLLIDTVYMANNEAIEKMANGVNNNQPVI